MPRKPVAINGMIFTSKKEAKSFLKEIFKQAKQAIGNGQKAILVGDQERFMKGLIATDSEFHTRVNGREVIGCEIKYAQVNDPKWHGRKYTAHLVFSDGSAVHFRTTDLISKL